MGLLVELGDCGDNGNEDYEGSSALEVRICVSADGCHSLAKLGTPEVLSTDAGCIFLSTYIPLRRDWRSDGFSNK